MPQSRVSRRSFLTSSAVGTGGLLAPAWLGGMAAHAAEAGILERLGVALFTVRDQMKADTNGTLKAIADLGYRYVESALLPSLGPAAKAVDEAKARGLEYLVVVYLQKAERGGLDVYRGLAARLAKAGEACKKAGLGLAYHAHAFEYEPIGGVRPIDILLKETPKDLLGLELDTFWASIAGMDPVKMVEANAGRVPLVHLKDKAKGTPVQYDEGKVPKDAFKEVGQGEVDYAKFLPAAAKAGVKYYYVEQDYCAGSPLDSLRASRQALSTLTAAKRG